MQLIMEPHVELLLKDIAAREGLHSSFRATVSANVIGKSFHGVVNFVTLEDDFKRIPLVVKKCHTDGLTRETQKTHDKFSNEILFYSEVVGRISRYGHLPRLPKYYGSVLTDLKETIVLEDLRAENFVLKPLSDGLDITHLNIVARALARLHDASLKWKEVDPSSFQTTLNSFKETFFVSHEKPESRKLANLVFEHALNAALGCVSPELGSRCKDYIKTHMLERLDELGVLVEPSAGDPFTSLLHGDAWCHNFLFKYDSKGDPIEVALVDWQMVRLGSPAMDILQCFLSSADISSLVRPMDFLSCYAEARCIKSELLLLDFPRWGRPALLLAICILVHGLAAENTAVADKFRLSQVLTNGTDGALPLETYNRVQGALKAALDLGLFTG